MNESRLGRRARDGRRSRVPAAAVRAKELRAFDSKTGEKLWRIETQTSLQAAPITYEVDGDAVTSR